MTENEIRALVDDYIAAEITADNHNWIGEPDADEIIENTHFRFGKDEQPDEDSTRENVIEATKNAVTQLLGARIYEYAEERYRKIEAGELFDSLGWKTGAGDIAQSLIEDKTADWQMETKKAINEDIETKFGKNCIKVATFDELCNAYDETLAQPFEEWFVEQTGFDKGEITDLQELFKELEKTYCDTRFAVCVPENIRQNWRHDPPIHECRIHEIDW